MQRTRMLGPIVLVLLSGSTALQAQPGQAGNAHATAGTSPHAAQIQRNWVGFRTFGSRTQAIRLQMPVDRMATVDLPDFGALAIPASNFRVKDKQIHFELVGDASTAVFDGRMKNDAIQGSWREGERAGEFSLTPAGSDRESFHEETVFFVNGAVRLAGTLLLPTRAKPVPAMVFVQGAGPETRSASRFMAEFFAEQGVAALIYDKRGAGESAGDWKHASFEALAGDVVAAVTLLKNHAGIDAHRIGLMGSSQGGWIAPMAATQMPEVAFVIVKSAADVTPEEQELARVEIQMREEGDSADDIEQALHLYKHAIAYARSGEDWDALKAEITADAAKKWSIFDADTARDYWFFDQIRLFFQHQPLPVMQALRCPLLVIFGGKDDDGPPLQAQVGPLLQAMSSHGKAAELVIFPDAGHDLRVVPEKGEAWDFGRFAPGYLDTLKTWVAAETK